MNIGAPEREIEIVPTSLPVPEALPVDAPLPGDAPVEPVLDPVDPPPQTQPVGPPSGAGRR